MNLFFRRGLVVGKFCPLHLGHELLIRRAQTECEELVVLSYTKPGFAGCLSTFCVITVNSRNCGRLL